MPFCPSCQIEYRSGFTRCSDCNVELVDSLPEENPVEPDRRGWDMVEVGTFPDPQHAQMIQELLENNGIASVLQSDFNAGTGPFTSSPNSLLVRKDDLPRARELYEQYFAGDQPEQGLEQCLDDPDQAES